MQHVDALSRAPTENAEYSIKDGLVYNVTVRKDEIMMYQHTDSDLSRKIRILEKHNNERTRREKGEILEYTLRNGMLYKIRNNKELYVVPKAMRKAIVIKNHDISSHFSVERTLHQISEFYYFPKIRNYVKRHISACVECLYAKRKPGKQSGELHPIPPGQRPFEIVNIDHVGPFISTTRKNKYILAAICNLTKFVHLYAVRDTKGNTTIKKLNQFIERFGPPKRFISDRGTVLPRKIFRNFATKTVLSIP